MWPAKTIHRIESFMSVGQPVLIGRVFKPFSVYNKFVGVSAFRQVEPDRPAKRALLHGQFSGVPAIKAPGDKGISCSCMACEKKGCIYFEIDGCVFSMGVCFLQVIVPVNGPATVDNEFIPVFTSAQWHYTDPAAVGRGHLQRPVLPIRKTSRQQSLTGSLVALEEKSHQ